MANDCCHSEKIIKDIGICDPCGRVQQYFPFEDDPNAKPVVIREGHVPGLEYIRKPSSIEIFYKGKLWATMSLASPDLEHITLRMIQSIAKCYLREGTLVGGKNLRQQVTELCARSKDDEWIRNQFPGADKNTIIRYIRDARKNSR
jgi:hypothetical protein